MRDRAEELLSSGLEELGIEPKRELIESSLLYLRELGEWNRMVRLVGNADMEVLVIRHFLDSLAVHHLLDRAGSPTESADIGSGGGFPGIPLALLHPGLKVHLVERKSGKASFLRAVTGRLGLTERVEVFEGDVRELRRSFPLLFCRAFMPISRAYPLLRKLLPPEGGLILVYGGRRKKIDEELRLIGGTDGGQRAVGPKGTVEIIPLHVPFLEEERHAVLFDFLVDSTRS